MRPDIRLFVYRDSGERDLIIRVRSLDGMNEEVRVSDIDMMRCQNQDEKATLLRDAIKDLAERTLLPVHDLLMLSAQGENAQYIRDFAFRIEARARGWPEPAVVPEPTPEPTPEPETGWQGFLNGITEAILKSQKNSAFPKARVVKGGHDGR